MRATHLFLAAGTMSLALFGFGCKKPDQLPDVGVRPSTSAFGTPVLPNAPVAPKPKPKPSAEREVAIANLSKALQALGQTNSFRSQLIAQTPNGSLTGDLEYTKTQGFHGKLRLPGPVDAEILVTDADVFFRTGTSSFQSIKDTQQGMELGQLTRAQFDVAQATSSIFTADTQLLDVREDFGCRLFVFERDINNTTETNQFCVKDGLPIYISSATPDRRLEFRYRDFNQPIQFPKP
jgi:hypothetical protein